MQAAAFRVAQEALLQQPRLFAPLSSITYHIGLTDITDENSWRWISVGGKLQLDSALWAAGEPSNVASPVFSSDAIPVRVSVCRAGGLYSSLQVI